MEHRIKGKVGVHKAEFSIVYKSRKTANSIYKSILPDNVKTPSGLKIETKIRERETDVKIWCLKGIETLLATIDDMLSCIQVSEDILKIVEELQGR
jgi:tRNA threonylcarbamoyladenosine modification (KEOPS) complex  Pcc1 subunit